MPPITRNQSRRNYQTEPYSKDGRPTEKRTALVDLVANNGSKKYVTRSESKKIEERVFNKNDNISNRKIEKKNKISQNRVDIIKCLVEKIPETRLSNSKDSVCSSSPLDNSKDSTLYQSAVEESTDCKLQRKCDESFLSAATESSLSGSTALVNSNSSELYESAIQEIVIPNERVVEKANERVVEKANERVVEKEEEIFDIDQTGWNNFVFVGCYARDIFKYLRNRQQQFVITDYISDQSELTPRHRAIVVNWLVNLQENFGLNHEVLYMAVKLIDLYLIKNQTPKDKFQLLASAALLLASKIDEREPGLPYDLVKQSRFIFTEDELFVTERTLFKALNFDINVPMSYCFLRRFARCMQVPMVMLTLARYILERCLMEYSFVTIKDSLKGASALYLAFQMCSKPLDHTEFYKYTGYYVRDIKDTVIALNNMLHTEHTGLTSIKQKYTHETFYRVARKPLLSNSKLQFD